MSIFATGLPFNKLTKVVPVFMAINNAYAPYAATAMHSLTQKCDKNRYYKVIILHDGLSWTNRIRLRNLVTDNVAIQFKKITRSLYLKAIIKYCTREKGAGDFFSSAVYYYRFFIPRLFPIYDKGVYIDSDTVLLGDIGDLYDLDLEDKVLAAMVDPKVTVIPEFRDYVDNAVGVPHTEYVNSGVMLMDFKKMRKIRYISTMVDLIEKYNADEQQIFIGADKQQRYKQHYVYQIEKRTDVIVKNAFYRFCFERYSGVCFAFSLTLGDL